MHHSFPAVARGGDMVLRNRKGEVLQVRSGEFYANRDRASLNLYAQGVITLRMAKKRICETNGWHHSDLDDAEFRRWAESLGYRR